ncbi:type IV fimbrial biogenesis protein FimT [Pseudoalteromonas translucida KMM 520]|uniref:Type II secretion system protein H n=1 Tax=Pseudoalteromonas translucida KMM 520 TaxID=1315283 RepID=A0A0U2ISJ6_9GAMM|nr:GspH/FimT family pseudopilin [Pseudoalteromonas translucida]ALS32943.1 type IV fimbrial biogenesis protein FimT [Pseudoalteromonas translucida KMM 520]
MLVNKKAGFTLIEMMVVLGIIGILAVVAAPSFSSFIKRDRLVTNANQLHGIYKFARSEAIKRDQQVSLIANNDQWQVKTDIDGSQTTLNIFTVTHDTININLVELEISSTGELGSSYSLKVTDDDNSGNFTLCILQSGQSWLVEGTTIC